MENYIEDDIRLIGERVKQEWKVKKRKLKLIKILAIIDQKNKNNL
jgi:hypothetical protein